MGYLMASQTSHRLYHDMFHIPRYSPQAVPWATASDTTCLIGRPYHERCHGVLSVPWTLPQAVPPVCKHPVGGAMGRKTGSPVSFQTSHRRCHGLFHWVEYKSCLTCHKRCRGSCCGFQNRPMGSAMDVAMAISVSHGHRRGLFNFRVNIPRAVPWTARLFIACHATCSMNCTIDAAL